MRIYFEKRVLWGFIFTVAILVVLTVLSIKGVQKVIMTAKLLTHGLFVVSNADLVVKSVVDVETGERGYVITGKEEYLEPFHESSRSVTKYLFKLDSLTTDDSIQTRNVDTLRALVNNSLEWMNNVVEAKKTDTDKAFAMVGTGRGKRTTDEIRVLVKRIQEQERITYVKSDVVSGKNLGQFLYSFLGLALAIAATIIGLFYVINKTLRNKNEISRALTVSRDEAQDLYDKSPCGYFSVDSAISFSSVNQTLLNWLGYEREEVMGKLKFEDFLTRDSRSEFISTFERDFENFKKEGFVSDLEFDFKRKDGTTFPVVVNSTATFDQQRNFVSSRSTVFDNTERKKAEMKIKQMNLELETKVAERTHQLAELNETLERKVSERTEQLNSANNDLNAFTYSVSHDLRAPLRSVSGYSEILMEDFGAKLDDEGKRVIGIISKNAARMGHLIDDLLDFSKLGRKELSKSPLDMQALVGEIVRDVTSHKHDQKIDITQKPLDPAHGDLSMMRQVWINLISNAVKYSGKKPLIEIEIGSYRENGNICYYVSDNGAGFDMQYADKLFGVFQRLHKASDFEGTGVGLALVKTIVTRHHGNVWAEGKVNEGAKFTFSMPLTHSD